MIFGQSADKPLKHGTMYVYAKIGCRCPLCREANALRQAAYRAKKRRGKA